MNAIQKLLESLGEMDGDVGVLGTKVCDLTEEEIKNHEAIAARGRVLKARAEELNLDGDQLQVDANRWWLEVRKARSLEAKSLKYDDGKLYDGKPAKTAPEKPAETVPA